MERSGSVFQRPRHPVARRLHGLFQRIAAKQPCVERGMESIARALDVAVDARVPALPDALGADGEVDDFPGGRSRAAGDDDGLQLALEQAACGNHRFLPTGDAPLATPAHPAEIAEFERVGRNKVGAGNEATAITLGQFGAHVQPAVGIAQHRVDADAPSSLTCCSRNPPPYLMS